MAYVSEREKRLLRQNIKQDTTQMPEVQPEPTNAASLRNSIREKYNPKKDVKAASGNKTPTTTTTTKETKNVERLPDSFFKERNLATKYAKKETVPAEDKGTLLGNFLTNVIPNIGKSIDKTTNKIGTFMDTTSAALAKAMGSPYDNADPSRPITTGNKTTDTVANILGLVESYFLPTGGGYGALGNTFTPAVNKATTYAATKIATSKIAPAILKKSGILQGLLQQALESIPYTVQQFVTGNIKPKDLGKATAENLALDIAIESVIGTVSKYAPQLFSKVKSALKGKAKNIDEVINIVDDVVKQSDTVDTVATKADTTMPSTASTKPVEPVNAKVDTNTMPNQEVAATPSQVPKSDIVTNNNTQIFKNKRPLQQRLTGDKLLDAQDTIEEIKKVNGIVDNDGYVTVYHATNKQSADNILNTGIMQAREDGLFFSTKADGQIKGYGESIIKLEIPIERLKIDDVFGDEIHFRFPLPNKIRTLAVSAYINKPSNVATKADTTMPSTASTKPVEPVNAKIDTNTIPKQEVVTTPSQIPKSDVVSGKDINAPAKDIPTQQVTSKLEPTIEKAATVDDVPTQFQGAKPGDADYKPIPIGGRTYVVNGKKVQEIPAHTFSDPDLQKTFDVNKGIKPVTVGQKINKITNYIKNIWTRPIATLPNTKEFAEAYYNRYGLINLKKANNKASFEANMILKDNVKELTPNMYDIFSKKIIFENFAEDASLGNSLPFGLDDAKVKMELSGIDVRITPEIQAALTKRQQYVDDTLQNYLQAMKDIGINRDKVFQRKNYYHHMVMKYANDNGLISAGSELKAPPKRGFTRARTGTSIEDINTDYFQSEYAVLSQMIYDTEVAKTWKMFDDVYSNPMITKLKAEAQKQNIKNWKELIPDTHAIVQPQKGNFFYMYEPTGEELVENVLKKQNLNLNSITDPQYQKAFQEIYDVLEEANPVLAVGRKHKELVLPKELVETINNMPKSRKQGLIGRLEKQVMNAFKSWVMIINPKSAFKAQLRNVSGDAEKVLSFQPKAIKKVLQAGTELFNATVNNNFSPALKDFFDRGGFSTTFLTNEITSIKKLKPFQQFYKKSVGETITAPVKAYIESIKNISNFREMVLRYATYLDNVDDLTKSGGKVLDYRTSNPQIVDGLQDIRDKAFKLSNDVVGAYDSVSAAGQYLREHWIPFWSFQETNFKTYTQGFKNLAEAGKGQKNTLIAGVKIAKKTATTLAKVLSLSASITAWNYLMHKDIEENELPNNVKNGLHIILGRKANGDPIYFTNVGTLTDYLQWWGLGDAPSDVIDLLNNKVTFKEVVMENLKQPVNKLAQGFRPDLKLGIEAFAKKKMYPDVTKPQTINDFPRHAAQTLGVKDVFDVATGRPHESTQVKNLGDLWDKLSGLFVYSSNPFETAYWNMVNEKYRYLEKQGNSGGSNFTKNKKSMALYNFKQAVRFGDENAKKKYLQEYKDEGGTREGMEQSLATMHPLYGIPENQRKKFIASLTESERESLKRAIQYYTQLRNK